MLLQTLAVEQAPNYILRDRQSTTDLSPPPKAIGYVNGVLYSPYTKSVACTFVCPTYIMYYLVVIVQHF